MFRIGLRSHRPCPSVKSGKRRCTAKASARPAVVASVIRHRFHGTWSGIVAESAARRVYADECSYRYVEMIYISSGTRCITHNLSTANHLKHVTCSLQVEHRKLWQGRGHDNGLVLGSSSVVQ